MLKAIFRKIKDNIHYLFLSLFASSAVADPISWSTFLQQLDELPIAERQHKIDAFLAKENKIPLRLENKVVFIYRGAKKHVYVAGDFNNWQPNLVMKKIHGTNIHYATLEFAEDARFEYKYVVDDHWLLDPLNPATAKGGYGENSDMSMPSYQEPKWFYHEIAKSKGSIETLSITSKILGNTRKLSVYTPYSYDKTHAYPLVVIHDGTDYIHLAHLQYLLDYLIEAKKIKPIIVVFIDPVRRNEEYGCSVLYQNFTKEEMVPFLEKQFSLSNKKQERIFAGASMGGIVSFFLANSLQDNFGGAICQSGAFIFPHMRASFGVDSNIQKYLRNVDYQKVKNIKLWIDCGTIGPLEQFLLEGNRHLHQTLLEQNIDHSYLEINEAHNWKNWAKQMELALPYFFTPQSE